MAEHVRVRKVAARAGRPVNVDDGHVIEGNELDSPAPGMPYAVRRTVDGLDNDNDAEVFSTSTVRVVITDAQTGAITLVTDNSRYAVEVIGR